MWPPQLIHDDQSRAEQSIQRLPPLSMFGSRRARAVLRHVTVNGLPCDVAAMGPWPGVVRNRSRVLLEDGKHEVAVGPWEDTGGWAWAMCLGVPPDFSATADVSVGYDVIVDGCSVGAWYDTALASEELRKGLALPANDPRCMASSGPFNGREAVIRTVEVACPGCVQLVEPTGTNISAVAGSGSSSAVLSGSNETAESVMFDGAPLLLPLLRTKGLLPDVAVDAFQEISSSLDLTPALEVGACRRARQMDNATSCSDIAGTINATSTELVATGLVLSAPTTTPSNASAAIVSIPISAQDFERIGGVFSLGRIDQARGSSLDVISRTVSIVLAGMQQSGQRDGTLDGIAVVLLAPFAQPSAPESTLESRSTTIGVQVIGVTAITNGPCCNATNATAVGAAPSSGTNAGQNGTSAGS